MQDNGIHIVKITGDKFAVNELAFIPHSISMVWFEPSLELLLVGNYEGVLQIIYVSHYRPKHSTKHLKGPTIKVDMREDQGSNNV